jgi:hypothetical protein
LVTHSSSEAIENVAKAVGAAVGVKVGNCVGTRDGITVGNSDGKTVGDKDGSNEGIDTISRHTLSTLPCAPGIHTPPSMRKFNQYREPPDIPQNVQDTTSDKSWLQNPVVRNSYSPSVKFAQDAMSNT